MMYIKLMYLQGNLGMNSETNSVTAELTGTPLELAYVKSRGAAHLKCASNSFVMFDRQTEKLTIFGTPPELAPGSFLDEQASYVLEDAQKHGAAFAVKDGRCSCHIGTVYAEGDSYIEAALRALIGYRSGGTLNLYQDET